MFRLSVSLVFLLSCRVGAVFEAGSFTDVLWTGGFEKGSVRKEYNEIVGKPPAGRTAIISSGGGLQPRCGKNFLHVKLDGSDTAYNHNRVEIGFHPTEQVPETMKGTTRYYGWSAAHDSSKPISADSTYELFYWESFDVWQQTIGFYMSDGRTLKLRTRGNGEKDVGSMSFPPGSWHDFVMGIGWSPQPNEGWVQLWMDGKEVVPKTSHSTMKWGKKSFSHLGLFRIPRVQTEAWMYLDCVVYAKGYTPGQGSGCYNDSPTMGSCKGGGGGGDDDDNDDDGGSSDGRRRSKPKPRPRPSDGRRRNDNNGDNNNDDNDNDAPRGSSSL